MATDEADPIAVAEVLLVDMAAVFDADMDRIRDLGRRTELEAVLAAHLAETLYPGIFKARADHDKYFWQAQAIGVPEDQARAVLGAVVAEARECWAQVDVHAVAHRRLLEGEENRPPEELRTIAREMHHHPYSWLGDDHPEAVDATARALATLMQAEADPAERLPDPARVLGTLTGPQRPPAGPRHTDGRPAWQSPYGPPRLREKR
ncbi:hypothetical protein [Streptomyces sp. ST2-7A]|uniref:hypothetical protein n=1 Tax=Streptomyces sp. ST2-7A TaxID=2907214 RepID=UPI001F1E955A|nr:hypothetical protein [Streptomyces sp. ST2-7A]MCE7081179.1 hypothetical protein [Streptomyces sp. ST2-7A]